MSNSSGRQSRKKSIVTASNTTEPTLQQQDESIAKLRSWIHSPIEPEKRLRNFFAEESLGPRSATKAVVTIKNLLPEEVAEGDFRMRYKPAQFYFYCMLPTSCNVFDSDYQDD